MDKKKIIGTIIGILAFVALIAGATYAVLTLSANVTNGSYITNTGEFDFTYSSSTDISGLLTLGSDDTYEDMNDATKGKITLTITKTATSPAASFFSIKLHVTTNTLTTSSIKYSVCSTTDCTGTVNGVVISNAIAGSDVTLYTSATDFQNAGSVAKTYYIYLWLDGSLLEEDDLEKQFGGYVFATATQAQSNVS